MAHELEYIVKDALMLCDKGAAPGFFRPTFNMTTKMNGCLVTTEVDKLPIVNIPSFGICSITQKPCIPVPTEWRNTSKVTTRGKRTLLYRSCMQCGLGGKMEFATSGQIPLPPDALEDIKKMQEEGLKEEEEGWGWLDTLELVPVIGSIVGAVREGMKGNWGMMVLNIGFLAADIAGVVSFGASTAASTAAKAAIKTGVKVAAKTAAKTAAKQVGKSGLKTGVKLSAKGAGKAFKSEMEGVVKKTGKSKKPVTSNPDPIGTFRDNAGRLRNKNGTFAKDPNKKTFVSKPTESYNRKKHYGNTPKKSDRKHLGAGKDEVADHDPPLVKRYYEGDPKIGEKPGYQMTPKERKTSANDRTRMKKQSKEDSNKQGAEMSRYSKKKKEEYGL